MLLMIKRTALLCMIVLISFVAACAPKDSVRLAYNPTDASVVPQAGAARLTVALLNDERGRAEVGARRSGGTFLPSSSVADWVSRSLADDISRMGLQVSYATSMEEAKAAKPNFIVSGTIHEVWVKQQDPTTYSATIRFSINLANDKGIIYSENISASQQKSTIPSSSMVEDLLTSTLREALGVAASKIYEKAK